MGKALPRTQRRGGGAAEALEGMWGQVRSASPNSHGGRWKVHTGGDLSIPTRRFSSGSSATGSGPTIPPAPVPNPTPHTFTPVTSNTGVNCTGPPAQEFFPISTLKYCQCVPALQFLNSILFGFLYCKNTRVCNTRNTPAYVIGRLLVNSRLSVGRFQEVKSYTQIFSCAGWEGLFKGPLCVLLVAGSVFMVFHNTRDPVVLSKKSESTLDK